MPSVIVSRAEVRAPESPCEHRWRHLRVEFESQIPGCPVALDKPIGDIFYCEKCLEYRRVERNRTTGGLAKSEGTLGEGLELQRPPLAEYVLRGKKRTRQM